MIGKKIINLKKVASTNTYAAGFLKNQTIPEGTVIWADEQISGRGQRGNIWESEPGKNLTFSIILYPRFIRAEEQFLISKIVSLAIYDFLDSLIAGVRIKWPNDIFVDNDKIAGILIESSIVGHTIENCIVGIGLNVNQTSFHSYLPDPVSLKIITGKSFDLKDTLSGLCGFLQKRYLQLKNQERDLMNSEYLSRQYRYNEFHLFHRGSEKFSAKITGVDPQGALILDLETGESQKFMFGEVEYVL